MRWFRVRAGIRVGCEGVEDGVVRLWWGLGWTLLGLGLGVRERGKGSGYFLENAAICIWAFSSYYNPRFSFKDIFEAAWKLLSHINFQKAASARTAASLSSALTDNGDLDKGSILLWLLGVKQFVNSH